MESYQVITLSIAAGIALIVLIGVIVTLTLQSRRLSDDLNEAQGTIKWNLRNVKEITNDRDNWKSTATALKADIETWKGDYAELKAVAQAVRAETVFLRAHSLDLSAMVKTATKKLAELGATTDKLIKKHEDSAIENLSIRDWSMPQAFPKGYIIKKETEAVRVGGQGSHVKRGTAGLIIPDGSDFPFFRFREADNLFCFIHSLAPVNPTDHPQHPEFKK
jgi:uncharacterized protein YoxC